VAPTVCDGTGKCVAASADGGAGGCAVGVLGATDDRSGLVWVALALGMLAKHTRAPRRKEMKR
jgi:hypothetical protein